ncbi:MAG: WG repeat-containing protein [Defluviitaleaceae bacterium]|nr:WG repeat-containing protein [Defluviitaleaceae bacterium]
MKKILLAICVTLAMVMLLGMNVQANTARPIIINVVQEELRANDSHDLVRLTITTNTVVDTVWVRHSTPELFPRAQLVNTTTNVKTWEISFTPSNPGSQYVSVEANRGFVSGGARHRLFVVYPTYAHLHEIIIPSGYRYSGLSSESMLVIRNNDGLSGLANIYGEIVVPAKYNDVRSFPEGLAAVRVGDSATGLWGFIDINGREVVPPRYHAVGNIINGFAQVRVGTSSERFEDWRFGFVNRLGVEIARPIYGQVRNFSDGFAAVQEANGTKWGFINERGNLAIPFRYPSLSYFHNGFALVRDECCDWFWNHNGLPMCGARTNGMALIDTRGDEVRFIQHACSSANSTVANYFSFFNLFGPEPSLALSEGLIWVRDPQTNLLGLADIMGNVLTPFKYSDTRRGFNEGMAWVSVSTQQNELWALLDNKGNEIVRPMYEEVSNFSEGLAAVWRDGYVGFIDKEGNEVIKPNKYSNVGAFINGLAPVQSSNGLWGFIDTSGNIVVPLEYTIVQYDGIVMLLGSGITHRFSISIGGRVTDAITPRTWKAYRVTFEDFPPNN